MLPRFSFWPLCRLFLLRISDEPGAMVVSQIRPGPFADHKKPIAEADQEKQVNEQPCQPGKISGDVELAKIGMPKAGRQDAA